MPCRREFLRALAALALPPALCGRAAAATGEARLRTIPRTGERLSAVGLGTWLTFDVARQPGALATRIELLRHFFDLGGTLIDSSPMYGTSEEVIGRCLAALDHPPGLFSAGKVWALGGWLGQRQMQKSARLWGVEHFDLMQVHNLLDADTQLGILREWQAAGRVRYVGVTTSGGERHDEIETLMRSGSVDFVQLTYNIVERAAEQRLLPLALEQGIAVLVNRPFRHSRLFDPVRATPLPAWTAEFDCGSWAQFFLKFILSHRAVTCVIPATSKIDHLSDNMAALHGRLPDPRTRRRMVEYIERL